MPLNRLLHWLRGRNTPPPAARTAPEPSPLSQADQIPSRAERLDLQEALILHLEWCVQFNDHLAAPPGQHAPEADGMAADRSPLGQWLAAMATRSLGRHPHFAELVDAHRQLHAHALETLHLTSTGRTDQACTLLNTGFERERLRVASLLREMQQG